MQLDACSHPGKIWCKLQVSVYNDRKPRSYSHRHGHHAMLADFDPVLWLVHNFIAVEVYIFTGLSITDRHSLSHVSARTRCLRCSVMCVALQQTAPSTGPAPRVTDKMARGSAVRLVALTEGWTAWETTHTWGNVEMAVLLALSIPCSVLMHIFIIISVWAFLSIKWCWKMSGFVEKKNKQTKTSQKVNWTQQMTFTLKMKIQRL